MSSWLLGSWNEYGPDSVGAPSDPQVVRPEVVELGVLRVAPLAAHAADRPVNSLTWIVAARQERLIDEVPDLERLVTGRPRKP